jgi:hypothetical protein
MLGCRGWGRKIGFCHFAEALLAGRPLPEPPEWLEAFPKWTSKDNLLSEGEDLFVALYDFQVGLLTRFRKGSSINFCDATKSIYDGVFLYRFQGKTNFHYWKARGSEYWVTIVMESGVKPDRLADELVGFHLITFLPSIHWKSTRGNKLH